MNLDSHFSLLFFLFFLTPGLYFDYLSKRHQSARKESSLQELGRIVGSSLIVVTPGMSLSLLISLTFKPENFSYLEFLRSPSSLFNQHPIIVLGILSISSFFSLIFVLLIDNFLIALKNPNFTDETIWNHFFSNQTPRKFIGWRYPFVSFFKRAIKVIREKSKRAQEVQTYLNAAAMITTIDSRQYVGIVEMWSSGENTYGREVMLTRVSKNQFSYLPQSFKDVYLKDSEWARMTIPESNILSIKLTYLEMKGG
jgi:hypothetical protein